MVDAVNCYGQNYAGYMPKASLMRQNNIKIQQDMIKKQKKQKRRRNFSIACYAVMGAAILGTILYACCKKRLPSDESLKTSDSVIDSVDVLESLNVLI